MPITEVENLLNNGLEALANGDTLSALVCFEKAIKIEDLPIIRSAYAFCIAKERGLFSKAISLCEEAIEKDAGNAEHYLNLGRILLLSNRKAEAVKVFRKGLNYELNHEIVNELNKLGLRKPPIIPFLKRSNPINKYLGILCRRLRPK